MFFVVGAVCSVFLSDCLFGGRCERFGEKGGDVASAVGEPDGGRPPPAGADAGGRRGAVLKLQQTWQQTSFHAPCSRMFLFFLQCVKP